MRADFELDWVVGDQASKLILSAPHGVGNNIFHLMLNNYYNGVAIFRQDRWVVIPNNAKFGAEEIEFIECFLTDNVFEE